MIATILGALALFAWLYLAFARGRFWRADVRLPDALPAPAAWPDVLAVVPARDEADAIRRAVVSLRAQDYPGTLRIVVADDRSADATAATARALGGVEVLSAGARPAGWAGKPWAMAEGARRAGDADFVWFADADVVHGPATLRRLVALAEEDRLDLASLMVRLHCAAFWERFLIPAFVFFFQMLYPFRRVGDPARRSAAAAGGSLLVRVSALARVGGIEAIRTELIDDCALARAIKRSGGRIWLGLSEDDESIRPYGGLSGIWRMVARTAFDELDYSTLRLAGAMLGLALVFMAPPVLVFLAPSDAGMIGAAAWALMALAEGPMLRLYRQPASFGLFLPLVALLYAGMTIDSARRHWQGRGGQWKGRTHRAVAGKG